MVDLEGHNALHFAARASKVDIIEHFVTEKIIDIESKNNVIIPFYPIHDINDVN